MEVALDSVKSHALDHHGLVGSICKDLKIAEKIDARMGKKDRRRIVSTGMAAVAMILNGLGFTNRRLYLTPQFFESKPLSELLGRDVGAKQLDDHALGKALDEIANYGSSQLFGEIAFEIALEHNLLGTLAHLDSTSLSVEGKYEADPEENVINLTYGHSKDHRSDLKQVVMSLVVSGKGTMPLWIDLKMVIALIKKHFTKRLEKCVRFKSN